MIELGAILLLIADLWAVLRCWGSTLSLTAKLLWTLLIIIFPLGGLILFILFGRARPASAHYR
ncbi:MAG: PLDc N-terminal domain-containing protein [candidate division Zixibacteria bacterium]